MVRIQNLSHAQALLDAFIPTSKSMRYTLDRMQALMAYLGNPQDNLKVVHIAGTSGKTSSSYYAAALLVKSGFRVGLSVSPHIDSVTERAQINLQPLIEKLYCSELGIFLDLVAESKLKPSYFELLVAFSYWLFERQKVDYAVMEVGLGGLLDATNVVHREDKICIITDIGLDHTEILSSILPEIAAQKAGIIQHGNSVFMHTQAPEIMAVIDEKAKREHATYEIVGVDELLESSAVFLALPAFQQRNISLVYGALKPILIPMKLSAVDEVLHVQVPSRMEERKFADKIVVLDGSHNEQKLTALAAAMKKQYAGIAIVLLVSFGENKATSLERNLKTLREISDHIIATKFSLGQDEIRSPIEPRIICDVADDLGFESKIVTDPREAFAYALAQQEKLVLVTGSFYLLNHIRPLMNLSESTQ